MHNVSVWGYLHQHRLIYPLKMLGASLSSLNDQQMLLRSLNLGMFVFNWVRLIRYSICLRICLFKVSYNI